ncbi:MAG: Hsp70 family protein [Polyangiaceae bacterium]
MAPFVVGLDLGTSNTVVGSADVGGSSTAAISLFPIRQRATATTIEERVLFPSCAYFPLENELDASAPLAGEEDGWILGEAARLRGTEIPDRAINSSKSWLCHPRVDKTAPILPWGESPVPKLSPVAMATRLLQRVRNAWDSTHPEARLAEQLVVLTVPASFDEVARELTLAAAESAGLRVRLLEEPQAAFYAAMREGAVARVVSSLRARGAERGYVLVVDVGGGTTDLTLLEIEAVATQGETSIKRIAVGSHLLLGGDNMDLALAHDLERGFVSADGEHLDPKRFAELVLACRRTKESLFSADAPAAVKVSLLGRGSQLLGGLKSVSLTRERAERVVLEGFFPLVEREAKPQRNRTALVAFGLPYERDTAVTRHVAAFVSRHLPAGAQVDAVLLNGGVFRAHALAARLVECVGSWQSDLPITLDAVDPDTAVAIGAVAYGLAVSGAGSRIGGGSPKSFFIGTGRSPNHKQLAVCALPKGTEEGSLVRADKTALKLLVGRPARFDAFTSDQVEAAAGDIVEVDDERFERLAPLTTTISADGIARGEVQVHLETELAPTGVLEIACVEAATATKEAAPRRFRLAFDPRGEDAAPLSEARASMAPSRRAGKTLDDALAEISRVYGKGTASEARDARNLPRELERLLGDREEWSADTARALADRLLDHLKGRRRTLDHERAFFQLVGFCLRPGFGAAGDEARVARLAPLFAERVAFPKEVRNWQQFFICYRRIAAGLDEPLQIAMRDELDPFVAPAELKLKKPKLQKPESSDYEILELLANLERLPPPRRADLGHWILERTWTKRDGRLWAAIGRLGAREPAYASVHHVTSPFVAEKWLDHLLRDKWADLPTAPRAASDLARMTGDRARDVSPSVRSEVVRRLEREGAPASLVLPVREIVEARGAERAAFFGERLPSGLSI